MKRFQTTLKVRIGDINYGAHLGHDRLITLLHQARLDFLHSLSSEIDISEVEFFGAGLIMRHLEIDYLKEAFLGDVLRFEVWIADVKALRFTIFYQVFRENDLLARAKTEMVSFDYQSRKVIKIPQKFIELLNQEKIHGS